MTKGLFFLLAASSLLAGAFTPNGYLQAAECYTQCAPQECPSCDTYCCPQDPCNPCAPVCGTRCGCNPLYLGAGVAVVGAVAAIILTSGGGGRDSGHSH